MTPPCYVTDPGRSDELNNHDKYVVCPVHQSSRDRSTDRNLAWGGELTAGFKVLHKHAQHQETFFL